MSKHLNYQLQSTEWVILYIIIGEVHQFIGRCLIPLDPCLTTDLESVLVILELALARYTSRKANSIRNTPGQTKSATEKNVEWERK